MSAFKPSTMACRARGCPHLIEGDPVETGAGTRKSWICKITGKIPGNMPAVKECDA